MSTTISAAAPCRTPRQWRLASTAAVLVLLGACQWGTRPQTLRPAHSPAGADVSLTVTGEGAGRRGELFAVDSLGVTIHAATLVRVRWSRLRALDVDKLGSDFDVSNGESVSAWKRGKLALVSRFPQGLSGPLLDQVLAALKQGSLEELQ